MNCQRLRPIKERRTDSDTITITIMRDQTGIMKGSIDTLATGILTAAGTIITATNQSLIISSEVTPIKSIAIPTIKSMVISPVLGIAGIKVIYTVGTNTALKAIPTASISNSEIVFRTTVSNIQGHLAPFAVVFASAGKSDLIPNSALSQFIFI